MRRKEAEEFTQSPEQQAALDMSLRALGLPTQEERERAWERLKELAKDRLENAVYLHDVEALGFSGGAALVVLGDPFAPLRRECVQTKTGEVVPFSVVVGILREVPRERLHDPVDTWPEDVRKKMSEIIVRWTIVG